MFFKWYICVFRERKNIGIVENGWFVKLFDIEVFGYFFNKK